MCGERRLVEAKWNVHQMSKLQTLKNEECYELLKIVASCFVDSTVSRNSFTY